MNTKKTYKIPSSLYQHTIIITQFFFPGLPTFIFLKLFYI
nr:MAG TPA: hypothetical protein [Caudoviricetes sp.]